MNEQTPVVKVEDFNVLDRKVQACPYPYYKAMRSECPVYQSPHTGMMYVTKYDDIRHIKRHPELFTSDMVAGDRSGEREATAEAGRILKTYGWEHVQVLQRTDPPDHGRWRQYIDKTFTALTLKGVEG